MSDSTVEAHVTGGVMTITLADEERRNALSRQLIGELLDACRAADADPSVRVVVLTNRGPVFCAGASLDEAGARGDRSVSPTGTAPDVTGLYRLFRASAKPYVGRIAGHCVAGGMGLAASMDVAIAADDTMFGFTEVRIGVAPAVISVVCLPKMRPGDARAAFLRGRRFPASDAVRLGLINAAVARADLDAEVDSVVDDLVAAGPGAIAATKQLLARVPGLAEDEAFEWARALSSELFAGAEAAEGMRAFKEKRPPAWVPVDRGGAPGGSSTGGVERPT